MTISSARNAKLFQEVGWMWWLCSSRVLAGQHGSAPVGICIVGASSAISIGSPLFWCWHQSREPMFLDDVIKRFEPVLYVYCSDLNTLTLFRAFGLDQPRDLDLLRGDELEQCRLALLRGLDAAPDCRHDVGGLFDPLT